MSGFVPSLGRELTETEEKVLDVYCSDHCRHSTFLTHITDVAFEDGVYKDVIEKAYKKYLELRNGEKPVTLMDMATVAMKELKKQGKLGDLDESDEINACSIKIKVNVNGIDEDWILQFKNETHNHPTEIVPFDGAATCLGGAIRDPMAGRAFVYQAMRITGCGDPRNNDVLPGKLPQKRITTEAADGYSFYGNRIGIPAGLVHEIYHEGYVAKRMELGAVIGAVKENAVNRRSPEVGDVVILIGGRTGRDGVGAASESSAGSSVVAEGIVPQGVPALERRIMRLFRNPEATLLIKKCNDFGAGGVCVAIGEIAESLEVDLNKVPIRDGVTLNGTEIAISESQERMAVVVAENEAERFIALANAENLEATVVAVVTDTGKLRLKWNGQYIVDLPRDFIETYGGTNKAKVKVTSPIAKKTDAQCASLQNANQCGLASQFNAVAGGQTVLMPYGGNAQLTPVQAMCAKIPVQNGDTDTCTLMSYGFDPYLSEWSPYHGAYIAVVDSVAKIAAAGGDYKKIRLSFQEYFESLGDDSAKWGKPFAALLGAFSAQMGFSIPAIGGKDSMSGTYKCKDGTVLNVPPTLVSFAVCVGNVSDIISPEFKQSGNYVGLLEVKKGEGDLPDIADCMEKYAALHDMIQKGEIISAYAVADGKLNVALTNMCIGNGIGVDVKVDNIEQIGYGSIVFESKTEIGTFKTIGKTTNGDKIVINGGTTLIGDAINALLKPLSDVFPFNVPKCGVSFVKISHPKSKASIKNAKPRVLIPVFEGANGEYELVRAFERDGGIVEIMPVFGGREQTLADAIRKCQIIAIPAGYYSNDVLSICRDGRLQEANMDLFANRDGLCLGIDGGFDLLVRLGLFGVDGFALVHNESKRHFSTANTLQVISNKSPWLMEYQAGDELFAAVSSDCTRIAMTESAKRKLEENGQIATQYAVSYSGSANGIEGITSTDGRIFGKLSRDDCYATGLLKNVAYNKEPSRIFKAGLTYFG